MMKTVKMAMIGVGQIGTRYLERYLEMPGVEITAVSGGTEERTAGVAEKYGIGRWTTDFREILAMGDVEAVNVCVHNNLHAPITIAALESGKHVFCEKPIAGSYRDGAAMLEAARKSGRHLAIQLATLFDIETRAAREAIEQGWLGKPYAAQVSDMRRRGRPYVDGYGTPAFVQRGEASGGAVIDLGVYSIAAVMHLLGNPAVQRISGRTFQETAMDEERRAISGYDLEELGVGLAYLDGGIVMTLVEAWAVHMDQPGGSWIAGSEGGVRLKPFSLFGTLGNLDLTATANLDQFRFRQRMVAGHGDAYDSPLHHFVAVLQGRVEPLPTAEIALNTMLLSEGIYLSDALGREVTAAEVAAQSRSTAKDV